MTDEEWRRRTARRPAQRPQIDASAPNVARVWDYLTGGRDNFDADRKAARQLMRACPVMEHAGHAARGFVVRATRYLAAEAGVRQFLDIGTGIPAAGGIHDVAKSIAPESRVVCVDNDPVVLSHARALLRPAPGGATGFVDADVREASAIVAEAGATLDFGKPVAVIMNHLLHHVPRDAEVRSILATLMGAVCPGSHLVVIHPASDLEPTMAEAARRWNRISRTQVVLRARPEVTDWFAGLDLIDPGVVAVDEWRPEASAATCGTSIPFYGIVGRKPSA